MLVRLLVYITISCVIPLIIVTFAFYATRESTYGGGFNRKFSKTNPQLYSKATLDKGGYSIAGNIGKQIFLFNDKDIHHLLVIDGDKLTDTHSIYINTHRLGINHIGVRTIVDSPWIFQQETSSPMLIRSRVDSIHFIKEKLPPARFWNIVPSYNQYFITKYDTALKQIIIARSNQDSLIGGQYLLQKQIDGIFSVDGQLLKADSGIIYIYNYRNQFIRLNNKLEEIYKRNTIDTNTTAKVKVGAVKSDNTFNLASPPPYVNKSVRIHKDYLYVYSALAADNQRYFDRNDAMIDMYRLSDGAYYSSFVIHSTGEPITDFLITNKKIFALTKHAIISLKAQ